MSASSHARGFRRLAAACVGTAAAATATLPAAAATFDCVARPKAVVSLGSSDQGVISAIAVDRGDVVEAGMVVAQLDSTLQALNVDLAELRANSDLDIRSSTARRDFRGAETRRAEDLHRRNVIPGKALEEARIEDDLAKLELESARLQRQMARVELAQARELRDRRSIRSPVDGVVVELTAAAGEYVYDQKHLMRIAEIDPLHVEAFLPVAEYGRVRIGMIGEVKMDAPIGGVHEAAVTVVDRVFDPESRTFGIRLALPNPDLALPAGVVCTVRLVYDEPPASPMAEAPGVDSEIDLKLGPDSRTH